MNYNLYLKYKTDLDLNINDEPDRLCERHFADIVHFNEAGKETKIGIICWKYFNQALARSYGLNMTQIREISYFHNRKAFMELDSTLISQETIDEIGAAGSPNIITPIYFGISAAWRNKGIGEQVIKGFIKQMKGKCGYIIILDNEPVQCSVYAHPDSLYGLQGIELAGLEKDLDKAQSSLNAFWLRCGFRQFKNYENVFICNVDQFVPEPGKARQSVI